MSLIYSKTRQHATLNKRRACSTRDWFSDNKVITKNMRPNFLNLNHLRRSLLKKTMTILKNPFHSCPWAPSHSVAAAHESDKWSGITKDASEKNSSFTTSISLLSKREIRNLPRKILRYKWTNGPKNSLDATWMSWNYRQDAHRTWMS